MIAFAIPAASGRATPTGFNGDLVMKAITTTPDQTVGTPSRALSPERREERAAG